MIALEPTAAALTIALFGPMQVWVCGQPIPHLRSRKTLWLLALLALRHNRSVERDWLAGTLWPDIDQSQAFANLRPVLSALRAALGEEGERLQAPNRQTLCLDLTGANVDVLTFDAAIASKTLSALERAVQLYKGPFLEGCTEEWVPQERAARQQNVLQALQTLAETALAAGDHSTAIGYWQRARDIDPFLDTARRGLMEALARSGDIPAALQVYRDARAAPDEKTTALYTRLRAEARRGAILPSEVSAETARVPVVRGYLPHPRTALVGREDERAEVATRLRRSRLVTLTGPGGMGKTRLAVAVAGDIVRDYPDGVWRVSLESSEPQVAERIASVLGVPVEAERPILQSLTEHLRGKRLLLFLDNCEQGSAVVGHLLRECAGLRILTTSREALAITGETAWSVPPLAVPDPEHLPRGNATLLRVMMGYEGIQLFMERAQAVQQSFLLTSANARPVAELCFHVEGSPLAIELAAAQIGALPVDQILAGLRAQQQGARGVIVLGGRTLASRSQTLRAVLAWAYSLLSSQERAVLEQLSALVGDWAGEAAEAICGEEGIEAGVLRESLTSLQEKALIVFDEDNGQYRLPDSVRQYAAEQLQAMSPLEECSGQASR